MSAFGKLLGIAVAAITLLAWTGVSVVSAQGPWNAPADAKATKNPVKGDGPAAAALPPPKPANWTAEAVQKQSDGELFWKISNGRGAMPPWKHLPDKDRWEIVNYIRTLKGK
jgi:Cytochrome C oxidase, cbb3-type, subunit III